MSEEHVTSKILTFLEPQGGAWGPDSRLGPDPGYAFQGEKNSCVPELKQLIKKISAGHASNLSMNLFSAQKAALPAAAEILADRWFVKITLEEQL